MQAAPTHSTASGQGFDDPDPGRSDEESDSGDEIPYRPDIHGGHPFLDSLPTSATAPHEGPSNWGEWVYADPSRPETGLWPRDDNRYYSLQVVQHPVRGASRIAFVISYAG
jgi:hypothetical protein